MRIEKLRRWRSAEPGRDNAGQDCCRVAGASAKSERRTSRVHAARPAPGRQCCCYETPQPRLNRHGHGVTHGLLYACSTAVCQRRPRWPRGVAFAPPGQLPTGRADAIRRYKMRLKWRFSGCSGRSGAALWRDRGRDLGDWMNLSFAAETFQEPICKPDFFWVYFPHVSFALQPARSTRRRASLRGRRRRSESLGPTGAGPCR